jgi:hypothetical protein
MFTHLLLLSVVSQPCQCVPGKGKKRRRKRKEGERKKTKDKTKTRERRALRTKRTHKREERNKEAKNSERKGTQAQAHKRAQEGASGVVFLFLVPLGFSFVFLSYVCVCGVWGLGVL